LPPASEFVQPLVARDDEGTRGAEPGQRIGIDRHIGGPRDADELARDLRRIGQRPHQVEDRAPADRLADRHDAAHRRVVARGKEEADADVRQRLFRRFGGAIEVEAQRLQRVGRAGLGTGGAVAVLGHRHAAGRDDQADGGGDVERVVPVAAGAADVDGVGGAFTGIIRARMARAAPAISLAVSPRSDSATRKAAIASSGPCHRESARRARRYPRRAGDQPAARSRRDFRIHAAQPQEIGQHGVAVFRGDRSGWNCTPWIGSSHGGSP
jgi:hypothetical protein